MEMEFEFPLHSLYIRPEIALDASTSLPAKTPWNNRWLKWGH